jgi:hypothetical protein
MRKFFFASAAAYGLVMSITMGWWAIRDYAMLDKVVAANGSPDIELRHRINSCFEGTWVLLGNIITLMAVKEL